MVSSFIIQPESPFTAEAQQLLVGLAATLTTITGASGNASFDPADVSQPRSVFVVARDQTGRVVGCGAIRPLSELIAEVKRMYAIDQTQGVGSAVLAYLEKQAHDWGYQQIWLETRRVNERAVAFYLRRGYEVIPNYGIYATRPEAICFAKQL